MRNALEKWREAMKVENSGEQCLSEAPEAGPNRRHIHVDQLVHRLHDQRYVVTAQRKSRNAL